MSKEVNRYKVFQTTRVRTALKNDGCWITKTKQDNEEQDKSSANHVGESKPSPVRQKSYVLSTAKKFESIESPPSSPYQKPQFCPSEGDSANQANGESIPPQPEGSTVEPKADAKPQAPTEEPIQNGEAQPETSVASTTAENNEEHVIVEDPVAETSAAADVEETKDTAEVPAVEVKPQEEQSTETQPANVTLLEDAAAAATHAEGEAAEEVVKAVAEVVAKSSSDTSDVVNATPGEEAALQNNPEPAAEIAVESTPESPAASTVQHVEVEAAEEAAEPVAEVAVDSTPEVPAATDAAGDKADAAPVTPVVTGAETELPTQPAAEAATEESSAEEAAGETVEAVAEAAVESTPESPAVTAAAEEDRVEAVADIASTKESSAEEAAGETVEAVAADVAVDSTPETPVVTGAAGEEAAPQVSVEPVPDILAESVSELPAQPATETAAEVSSAELAAGETVEAVTVAAVESTPETPAVTPAAGEEAAIQDNIEMIPDLVADTVSESPPQPTAETVECRVESAASAEPVLNTSVESEVQPVDNTAVEQSVVELNIEDALEPVAASDAEDKSSDRLIKLTDALDVEPPAAETAPEPPKDPEQSHTEEAKPNQDSNIFEKPVEKPQTQIVIRNTNICSFCDNRIEGNVKIHLSEPPVTCHPDCLKCGVCARFLGDLLTPMFLHVHVIQCGGCFAKVLVT